MPLRTKMQVVLTWLVAAFTLGLAAAVPSRGWIAFGLLLVISVLSSDLLVKLPSSDGSMSANFPFLLLGLTLLSPLQALLVAAAAIAKTAKIALRSRTPMAVLQFSFNVANTILATGCAYGTYTIAHRHMTSGLSLALASVSYFLWNTGSFAAVIAPSRGEKIHKLWLAEFPWYLPFYLLGATLAALTRWLGIHFGWPTAAMLVPAVYALYHSWAKQRERLLERELQLAEIEALHLRMIEGLAMAIEAKDQNTHDHLFRVRDLVQAVGTTIKLNDLEMKALEIAAFLHDIGKLAVPEHIINKPGKLTQEEFSRMTIHPAVGAEILERVRFPYPVVPIVRSHHEWWNGAGYPDGLQGKAIPIGARILIVIDCYDALVSDRPYRKGMAEAQALDILKSLSGKQFDPEVVSAFEASLNTSLRPPEVMLQGAFTPLDAAPEVWRGLAPGAGFEAGSDENAPARAPGSDILLGETEALRHLATAREEAQRLFELGQNSDRSLGLNDLLQLLTLRLHRHLSHDACALYVKANGTFRLRAVAGESATAFTGAPIRLGEGITGWVAQSGRPLLNGNTAAEPGCPLGRNGKSLFQSALAFPLFGTEGQLFAVLTLYAHGGEHFGKRHLRVLGTMAPRLSLALSNALLSAARTPGTDTGTDFVTGLPHADRLFLHLESALTRARSTASRVAVTSCSLPALPEVTSRRGVTETNRALAGIAHELRRADGGRSFVARTGSNEFGIVTSQLSLDSASGRLSALDADILAALRQAGFSGPHPVALGTAFFPTDAETAEALLATATRRMALAAESPLLTTRGANHLMPALTGRS